MTAEEAAAALVGAKSNTSGVFTLDQLMAMGKTGTLAEQWKAQSAPPGGLIAGGGNDAITATGLQKGYYQIPGKDGAEYYDPASGQASAEFVAWANSLTPDQRDPFTGQPQGFIPLEGGPQATNDANQPSAQSLANFNAILAGGGTQDAQDRVLGTGKYQAFVTGANGEQLRLPDVLSATPKESMFKDVSTHKSDLGPVGAGGAYGHWQTDATGSMWVNTGTKADFSAIEADARAAQAAKDQHNVDAYHGLQQERIARGEDPNTGISAAETKQIYETYQRIQDPAQREAYIRAQDPGNLTAGLRVARTAARGGEQSWMTKNVMAPETTYEGTQKYGGSSDTKGQVKTTYGDVTQTDAATGRSIMFGHVATKIEYVAPESLGAFGNAMHRLGGGLYGGIMGYIGSFGSPLGAAVGAAEGSGALGGINLKKPGKTTWGAAETPGSIQSVLLSLGEAMAFAHFGVGNMGAAARIGIGAGMGSVNGFLAGGVKGAEFGGVIGGVGGYLAGGNGPSAAAKAQNAWMGF